MPETKDCHLTGYSLRLRIKGKKNDKWKSNKGIYDLVRVIAEMDYGGEDSKARVVGEFDVALFAENISDFNANGKTIFNFRVGRITDQRHPSIDGEGHFSSSPLPDGKRLCYLTHGCFIFGEHTNYLSCILILERRFYTLHLVEFLKYLLEFDKDIKFDVQNIANPEELLSRLREIPKATMMIVKNINAVISRPNARMGTRVADRQRQVARSVKQITIDLLSGHSTIAKVKSTFKDILHLETDPTNQELIDLLEDTDTVIFGKRNTDGNYVWIKLLGDTVLYQIKVSLNDAKELNSQEFFVKLGQKLTDQETTKLIRLSRQFYDSVEIVDAPQQPQNTEG